MNKIPFSLSAQAERVKMIYKALSDLMKKLGFEAWIVGGFVRDLILNKEAKDVDIVVNVESIQIFYKALKKIGYKSITYDKKDNENNMKFEVLKFKLMLEDGSEEDIDVAIPRKETYSEDSRKPSKVEFAKEGIKEDAKRRDLTINALYLRLGIGNIDKLFDKDGKVDTTVIEEFVEDPTGKGLNNLYGYDGDSWVGVPVMKMTNKPEVLYGDDPLRILRAYRFLTKGFRFGEGMEEALANSSQYFLVGTKISYERIRDEFSKILLKSSSELSFVVVDIMEQMQKDGILELFLPEIAEMKGYNQNNHHHMFDLWGHTMAVLRYLKQNEQYFNEKCCEKAGIEEDVISLKDAGLSTEGLPLYICLLLAGLLHDVAKPRTMTKDEKGESHYIDHEKIGGQMAVKILERLKYTNDIQKLVKVIIERHMILKDFTKQIGNDKQLRNIREKFILNMHGKKIDIQNVCVLLMKADDSSKNGKFNDLSNIFNETSFEEKWENYIERIKTLPPPPKFDFNGEIVAARYGLPMPSKELGNKIRDLKELFRKLNENPFYDEVKSLEELMRIYDKTQEVIKPTSSPEEQNEMIAKYTLDQVRKTIDNPGYTDRTKLHYIDWIMSDVQAAYIAGIARVSVKGEKREIDLIEKIKEAAEEYVKLYEQERASSGKVFDEYRTKNRRVWLYDQWMHDALWAAYISGIEDVLHIRVIH